MKTLFFLPAYFLIIFTFTQNVLFRADNNYKTKSYKPENRLNSWPNISRGINGLYVYFETCSETFEPTPVGESYTMEISKIFHSYYVGKGKYGDYRIESLCLNVKRRNFRGQYMPKNIVKRKLALSFDAAREEVFVAFEAGGVNENSLRNYFLKRLVINLRNAFGGNPKARSGTCSGNIPITENKFQTAWQGTCIGYY